MIFTSQKWWWFPESIFPEGGRIDRLFVLMGMITLPVLVLLLLGLLYFFIAFHHKKHPKSVPITGFPAFWPTLLIIVILLLMELPLDIYSKSIWAVLRLHFPKEQESIQVRVAPQQFAWNFLYAGRDGTFNTEDDASSMNALVVPVNVPVVLTLKSLDVLHSFFVPAFRIKQDAVPGQKSRLWFRAEKKGDYEVVCAQLCGMAHFNMRAMIHVVDERQFEKFLKGNAEMVNKEFWGKWK